MNNNHEIRVKCTADQHAKIKAKADKIKLSMRDYLLHLGLHSRVEIKLIPKEPNPEEIKSPKLPR